MRVGWDPEGLELGQVGWKEEPGQGGYRAGRWRTGRDLQTSWSGFDVGVKRRVGGQGGPQAFWPVPLIGGAAITEVGVAAGRAGR